MKGNNKRRIYRHRGEFSDTCGTNCDIKAKQAAKYKKKNNNNNKCPKFH
jgi:hypothetical protein